MSLGTRDRLGSAGAMAALALMVVAVGPAQGDLYNYIAAASAWIEGEDTARLVGLTDYRWLADQAARAGLGDRLVGYTVITPPSLLFGAPLLALGVEHAGRAWQIIQGVLLLLCGLCMARAVRRPLWFGLLPFLLLGPAVWSHLWQGQMHLPAVLALSGGAWAWRSGRRGLAGAAFALAVGLKVHAWPVLVLLALWRAWRSLGIAVGVLLLGGGLSVALLGWPVHELWLSEGVPAGASGMFIDPWHPNFQSLGHGLRRAFVSHPTLNTGTSASMPGVAGGVAGAVQGLVVGISLVAGLAGMRPGGSDSGSSWQRSLAICAVAALVSGPILSGYHLVLLAPPLAWCLDALWRDGRRRHALVVAALAVAVAAVPPIPEASALLSVPRAWFALLLWAAMLPWPSVGSRRSLAALVLAGLMAISGARRATEWDAVGDGAEPVEHPDAPLILSELTQTEDGALWFSAIATDRGGAPGRGWVGMRWDVVAGGAPEVVATHPSTHVWAPVPTGPDAVAWSEGPAEPRAVGCVFPDGRSVEVRPLDGPADLWITGADRRQDRLTNHPGRDTWPVCDAARGRVWFLSDRRVGSRALRLWWVAVPGA